METDSTERAEATAEAVADPFAVDLFAASRAAAEPAPSADDTRALSASAPSASAPSVSWHARLPKVTRAEARFSASLSRLPPALSAGGLETLSRVLARYAHAAPEQVRVEAVDAREVNVPAWAARACDDAAAPCVFVTLAFEPHAARAYLTADAAFASALVRRVLTGEAAPPDELRPLSKTELAVIEFLCLSLVHELNTAAGEPLLRLERVSNERPSRLVRAGANDAANDARRDGEGTREERAGRNTRGLLSTVRVGLPPTLGLVRVLFDAEALEALDARRHPLLAASRERQGSQAARLGRFVRDVGVRLLVGETRAGADELAALEPGDVLLVERPRVGWGDGFIEGGAAVLVGDGAGVRLEGVAETADGGAVRLRVEGLTVEDAGEAWRLSEMQEDDLETGAGDEGAGVLEGLMLTLHVEMAARRITLDELARLRAGQILELGCRPDDPVELVADGRRVATGELVDVEGRLGVRITRLAG